MGVKPVLRNGGTHPAHQILIISNIMPRQQHRSEHFLGLEQMVEFLDPAWLRIGGYWYPRGGIPIDVFWQSGAPPDGTWIPPQDVAPYRGRG